MKQLILILAVLASATARAEYTADAQYGVAYNQAELRLQYLPADGDLPYLTIYGQGEKFEQVKSWFDTNPELQRLKAQTRWNAISTQSQMFKARYAASTPARLTIRLQAPDGSVIRDFTDADLPMSAEAYVRLLNKSECLRNLCRPRQPNQTDPPAQPLPLEPPPVAPVKPKPADSPLWIPIALVIAATIIGGGLGVRRQWKRTHGI